MNLVNQIIDQLSGGTLDKLSSLLGADSEATETAASAAVPALLSGLAGMASNDTGARKLTNVLGGLDSDFGNLSQMLGGDSSGLMQKGMGLLNSVLGDNLVGSISNAIGRYAGLNAGTTKNLLAYLLPLVLGKVAAQWKSQGGTSGALKNLFEGQRANIADAMPAGFSPGNIPGWEDVRSTKYATQETSNRVDRREPAIATRSPVSWLLPLALLLGGGLVVWSMMRPRPDEPAEVAQADSAEDDAREVTTMKPVTPEAPAIPGVQPLMDDAKAIFTSFKAELANIKDAASAEAAEPRLREIDRKLDAMSEQIATLPAAGQTAIRTFLDEQFATFKDQVDRTAATPGLSEQIRTLIDQIIAKLRALVTGQEAPSAETP